MTSPAVGPIARGPQPDAPFVVWAATITTWFTVGGIACLSGWLTLGALLLGAPLADAFDISHWWLWVLAIEAAVLASCAGTAMLAHRVLRGSNVARWSLVAGAAVTAVVGVFGVYYIWPVLVSLAALVVLVLLLLPGTGRWTRTAAA